MVSLETDVAVLRGGYSPDKKKQTKEMIILIIDNDDEVELVEPNGYRNQKLKTQI